MKHFQIIIGVINSPAPNTLIASFGGIAYTRVMISCGYNSLGKEENINFY